MRLRRPGRARLRTADRLRERATLANCPFHALAQSHTDLVCQMNLALVDALVDEIGDVDAHLDPAEGRCCVTLAARSR